MTENLFLKAVASFFTSLVMYWMYIPPSYAIIIVLIITDTLFGTVVAFRDNKFKVRSMMWGVFRKFAAFPMFVICDMVEQPLHIGFHLESYFALFVMAFEFISVVQQYADLGGPGAAFLVTVAQRVKGSLNAAAIPTVNVKVESTTIGQTPTEAQPIVPPPVTIIKETHVEKRPDPTKVPEAPLPTEEKE